MKMRVEVPQFWAELPATFAALVRKAFALARVEDAAMIEKIDADYNRALPCVKFLIERLGIAIERFYNPNVPPWSGSSPDESGNDVVAIITGVGQIGIQVTDFDVCVAPTGFGPIRVTPGKARGIEKSFFQKSKDVEPIISGSYIENDPTILLERLRRTIECKTRKSFGSVKEGWLLVVGNVPNKGEVISTFAALSFNLQSLTDATSGLLEKSAFKCCFFLPIMDARATLYRWQRGSSWTKSVADEARRYTPDVLRDKSWVRPNLDPTCLDIGAELTHMERRCDEEVVNCLRENRSRKSSAN